jgi:hypothetical protein
MPLHIQYIYVGITNCFTLFYRKLKWMGLQEAYSRFTLYLFRCASQDATSIGARGFVVIFMCFHCEEGRRGNLFRRAGEAGSPLERG